MKKVEDGHVNRLGKGLIKFTNPDLKKFNISRPSCYLLQDHLQPFSRPFSFACDADTKGYFQGQKRDFFLHKVNNDLIFVPDSLLVHFSTKPKL